MITAYETRLEEEDGPEGILTEGYVTQSATSIYCELKKWQQQRTEN